MTAAYRTAPDQTLTTMPPGIPYIIGNEAAERFSFYGMKAILYLYLTKYIVDAAGVSAVYDKEDATALLHLFVAAAYLFPIVGGPLADFYLGKYRVILWLSWAYCLGHLSLAAIDGRNGLWLGLALIAIGAGGIKPCVSSHVGDQFGQGNQHLISRIFRWFYFVINVGALTAMFCIPRTRDIFLSPENGQAYLKYVLPADWLNAILPHFSPTLAHHVAFGIPGVLMLLATIVFWMGRNKFVHIPPSTDEFMKELEPILERAPFLKYFPPIMFVAIFMNPENRRAILKLLPLFAFIVVFWALFDQTMSTWVEQATHMNLTVLRWRDWEWKVLPDETQTLNPLFVLMFIPLLDFVVFPALSKVVQLSALRRVSVGLFLASMAFAVSGFIQMEIDQNFTPWVLWLVFPYAIITVAEVLVSTTCLEFSYTQAPNRLKSIIMSLYLLSVFGGNLLTSGVNWMISRDDGTSMLPGASYYWFFSILMFVTAVCFIPYAVLSRESRFIQGEDAPTAPQGKRK